MANDAFNSRPGTSNRAVFGAHGQYDGVEIFAQRLEQVTPTCALVTNATPSADI
jgi:hypothetical protein